MPALELCQRRLPGLAIEALRAHLGDLPAQVRYADLVQSLGWSDAASVAYVDEHPWSEFGEWVRERAKPHFDPDALLHTRPLDVGDTLRMHLAYTAAHDAGVRTGSDGGDRTFWEAYWDAFWKSSLAEDAVQSAEFVRLYGEY